MKRRIQKTLLYSQASQLSRPGSHLRIVRDTGTVKRDENGIHPHLVGDMTEMKARVLFMIDIVMIHQEIIKGDIDHIFQDTLLVMHAINKNCKNIPLDLRHSSLIESFVQY